MPESNFYRINQGSLFLSDILPDVALRFLPLFPLLTSSLLFFLTRGSNDRGCRTIQTVKPVEASEVMILGYKTELAWTWIIGDNGPSGVRHVRGVLTAVITATTVSTTV